MEIRNPLKRAYTVPEAVKATGVSRATLYRMRAAGALPMFSWGGRTLIHADVLEAALNAASGHTPRR